MKNDKDGSNDDHGINYDDNDYDVNSEQMTENILLLCIFSLKKKGPKSLGKAHIGWSTEELPPSDG